MSVFSDHQLKADLTECVVCHTLGKHKCSGYTGDCCCFCFTGVNSIFSKMDCDRSAIEDKLGSSKGITENNIMSYLGLVEQKTNELLTIHTFLNSKVNLCVFL